jgi:hypothetical protein
MNRFKLLAGLCLQGIFLAAPAYAAPTITPTLSGTAGTNGWYVSDVTVTWSVVDPDFPILSTLGCDPVTVDFDTGGTFVSCQATSAGGISTQTVRVQRDVTPPELSLFIPADGASYTIDSGVNTEWTSRDLTSGAMPVQLTDGPFDLSTLGVKTFGVSVSDRAGNVTQVTHSYTVIDLPDTTAPVITPAITGTLGNNGWYTSDVVISWSVVEEESTISASSGCDTATLSTDTVGTSYTCSATSEGGSASASVTILRDATAPVITLNSPLDASEFVLDSVVNADWSVADAQSGVASESGSTVSGAAIDTASLGGKVYGVSATDNAGNSTNLEHAYSVVPAPDTSAPMISATVNGTLGDNGWYTSDVSVSWNISDAESPITASTGCEAVTLVDDTAGVTLTCLATSDGGSASASVTILRDATAPVITLSSPADASEFELGSAVLADWSVSDGWRGGGERLHRERHRH